MAFRQYRRTSSGLDAGLHAVLYTLTIMTAPFWLPVVLAIVLIQSCNENYPATKAKKAQAEAIKQAQLLAEQERMRLAGEAAAHSPWDELRCKALFVRLNRAIDSANSGSDSAAVEASTLRSQVANHSCNKFLSEPTAAASATSTAIASPKKVTSVQKIMPSQSNDSAVKPNRSLEEMALSHAEKRCAKIFGSNPTAYCLKREIKNYKDLDRIKQLALNGSEQFKEAFDHAWKACSRIYGQNLTASCLQREMRNFDEVKKLRTTRRIEDR